MLKKISCFAVCGFLLLLSSAAIAGKGRVQIGVSPVPPNLSVQAAFAETSGNKILDAEETGTLVLTLRNNGSGDAFDVRVQIHAQGKAVGLSFEREVLVGTIPAGQTVKKEVALTASEDVPTANVSLSIDVKEANGFDPNPLKVSFKTRAFEPPRLVVADIGINDQNGNSRVEPMEMVEMTVRVQNTGHGDARGVAADVQVGSNVFLAGDARTHFDLGAIPSGNYRDFKFMFYTNNRIAGGEKIPITVSLQEARPKFNIEKALALTMNAPGRRTQEFVVRGDEGPQMKEIELVGGLSVDVDVNIPEGQKAGKYDIAVIIGNKTYVENIPEVAYADRDARMMKEYVRRVMGFEENNIIYVEDAPLSKLNEIFGTERAPKGRLYKYLKPQVSRVFIYYGGHGAPDLESGDAFFVPVDGNPEYIRASGYRLQTFYDNLSKLPAKKITVVLDACFSGNTDKGMLFKGISPAMVKVKKEYRGPTGAVLMTSASVDQVSAWYPEKRHSLFTYFFLKGMQGEADHNKDRKITVGELSEYLNENVPYMARRLKGLEQQPVIMGNAKDVLAELKK